MLDATPNANQWDIVCVGYARVGFLLGMWISNYLETFMGVEQRTGEGSKPRIPRVVSKSDRDHGTATTAIEPLG